MGDQERELKRLRKKHSEALIASLADTSLFDKNLIICVILVVISG